MTLALWWIRRDLRLADHPALHHAARGDLSVLPVYIDDPSVPEGAAARAWRHRSLQALDAGLREHGSRLLIRQGAAEDIVAELADTHAATAVLCSQPMSAAEHAQHARVGTRMRAHGAPCRSFNTHLLLDTDTPRTKTGDPYKVFTPYWKAASATLTPPPWFRAANVLPRFVDAGKDGLPLDALLLVPPLRWDAGFWDEWTPGEHGAQRRLEAFVATACTGYAEQRDFPANEGTSRLSPHLHFGELSPWRIVERIGWPPRSDDAAVYIKELGWREFAHYVLQHFPHTETANFNPKFDAFAWNEPDARLLEAWQRGRTGIPLVDAGMRQLWQTGWMHNRVRMIVGSLLTKNLRLHWQHGAAWFMDTLVDADMASNTLGWQWVAGTGVDAAPYFRIFNPVTQAERFDPVGDYIARWVPELASLPAKWRLQPWEAPQRVAYPAPIVDLRASRDAALAALKALA